MSARVCFVVGARPNFMKSAPVYRELAALDPSLELLLLHTGQHYDDAMSDVFFRELGMPRPDEFLAVGSGSHAEQTAKVLVGVERVLLEHEIDLCVVAGDVNSTIAAALAAVKLGIPIAHIEAGLRSFDRAMPEEHNRVLTDHLSDILLAHSEEAITNLQREGISTGVHLVGNTMIDTLLEHLDKARERQSWEQFGLHAGEYALVTLHRPALVDDPAKLTAVTDGLITLAQASIPAPEWVIGVPRARSFRSLGLPLLGDTPDFTIHLVPSTAPSGGVSGLGTIALAPAVANAIYAATGKRLRALPFEVASKSGSCWSTSARPTRPTRAPSAAISPSS